MAGFSISLKGNKEKKHTGASKKKKRVNVFNPDEDKGNKRTKIPLTHVDEFKEPISKKLVIKVANSQPAMNTKATEKGSVVSGLNYGLTKINNENNGDGTNEQQRNVVFGANQTITGDIPDETAQEEYEEVPVEEFGAALLRGMGWKDDDGSTDVTAKKKKTILPHEQPRQEFLGIGANSVFKESSNSKEVRQTFMPIVKIDKRAVNAFRISPER